MKRFELGMSLDYAGDWGITEAVREFFQNALDEQTAQPENEMYFHHDKDSNILTIANKKSKLTPKSLLLGVSSKREDSKLIGQHGEGYKVATVVLMRNNITVKVYNNEAKEVWTSKVVKSRRYDTNIVVFDIEKKIFSNKYDLLFELHGITEEMMKDIIDSNLHLQGDLGEVRVSTNGTLLLDKKYKGSVFVNGLFVCKKDTLSWGYDFKPEVIKLDRDRGLVDTFDLCFVIGRLLYDLGDIEFVKNNIDRVDLQYIHCALGDNDFSRELSDALYNNFKGTHGTDAIPVESYDLYESYVKMGIKAVYVPRNVNQVIQKFHPVEISYCKTIDDRFKEWYEKAKGMLSEEMLKELVNLWNCK